MFKWFVKRSVQLLMVAALIVAFGAGVLVASPGVTPASAQDQYTMGNAEIASVYEDVSQGVVNITVIQQATMGMTDEGEGDLLPQIPFPDDQLQPPTPQGGQGSGFVIDAEGHIVTNYHVVQGADKITVAFRDGTLARAEVVGEDPESDIAVIKVDVAPEVLRPLTFADSSALYVGQPVLAIGSPFGQDWTLTTGIVSALGRTINSGFTGFSISSGIQTDAAINPGNSGGPLLNTNGEVIGVNAQILSGARTNSGVGFAIPSNLVQKVANVLMTTGEYKYAWLGISGQSLNLDLIEALELPANQRGVLVNEVTANGPADKAGLHGSDAVIQFEGQQLRVGGDIITAVNGESIRFMDELIAYLVEETQPGDQVTLTVLRDGKAQDITVTLGERADAEISQTMN